MKSTVQQLMWEKTGILREGRELKDGLRHLVHVRSHVKLPSADRSECELMNMMTVAEMVTITAMAREESRGAHYRVDFPYGNDQVFKKHSVISKSNHVDFIDINVSASAVIEKI